MPIDTIQKDHTLTYTDYSPYTLGWSGWAAGLTNQEKRRQIALKLADKTVAISPVKVSRKIATDREITSYDGEFKTVVGGLTRVRAYYDGTDNTGEIKIGQPIAFDTVTGKAVTGINEKWTADEFHIVGISFSNYSLITEQTNHKDIIIARLERPKNHHQGVIMAVTAEEYAEAPDHGYVDTDKVDLPVIFHTWEEVDGVLTLTPQSTYAIYRAVSPYGWLPPGVPVDVIMQNDRYLILRPPAMLHGVALSGIPTAVWNADIPTVEGDACTQYTLGSNNVQIWHKVGSHYAKQEYSNGDPVTMTWKNVSEAVVSNKVLIAAINAENEWEVIVEPCDLACDPLSDVYTP